MRNLISALLTSVAICASAEPFLVLDIAAEAGDGEVVIDLMPEIAPLHVERVVALAESGEYDNVAFHRVIDGFMAQTGDVEHGKMDGNLQRAGSGGSKLGQVPAEFSDVPFDRGVVGMARSSNPDSASSQFFIMFDQGHFLNGDYTVFGTVVAGMDIVDGIKRGDDPRSGAVTDPDFVRSATITNTYKPAD